ncbi:HNH endonuclease-domain-containing protein [Aspergillus karnatakaensis]|uniref:HNH endonuclease signature motif containing protein n=1 Tax=Aspergillus karnatakaensis TaxID=1810916 RepID=UPI003CCD35BA
MAARILEAPRSTTRRNIHIYHHSGHILGGTYQNGSLTGKNLYALCPLFLDFPQATLWSIFHVGDDGNTGPILPRDGTTLGLGRYIVLKQDGTPLDVQTTTREAVRRVPSHPVSSSRMSSQQRWFRDILRERDGVCAVTGSGTAGDPEGLEASHIFPIAAQQEWMRNRYDHQWITDQIDADKVGEYKMYSPQNGLLLEASLHHRFDRYSFAINPQDGYKVTVFKKDTFIGGIDGRALREEAWGTGRGSEQWRVSDGALLWHFEQAVLKNMKGAAGEQWPDWEFDFSMGGDMLGEIREGPEPGERMELELGNRLGVDDGMRSTWKYLFLIVSLVYFS